jgi:CDP-diacylglycerol--glycerol-3-phosphate 3-phosphatidyltransferase
MNLADRLTFLRIFLAPVFFIIYFMPRFMPAEFTGMVIWNVVLLWIVGIVSEITDMLDGMAARRLNQVSDFGKLFDPFADTLLQLTAFLCFVMDGVFPAVLFLVVLYREFGILFIRNLMLRKGIAMGARISGKIKTVTYITAATIALFYISLYRLNVFAFLQPIVKITAIVVFCVSVLFSVMSFFDYLSVYRKATVKQD